MNVRSLLLIQLVFITTFILDVLVRNDLLRQIVGFVYLASFGSLLLAIIVRNETELSLSKFLVLTLGLSMSFLMFFGFVLNLVSVAFNLKPFTESILVPALICCYTVMLCILHRSKSKIILKYGSISKFKLLSANLLVLAIMSVMMINHYNVELPSLAVLLILSLIPIVVALNRINPEEYPFLLWVIALSLLYMNSLYGSYFRATDNICEYNYIKVVIQNGFWDNTLSAKINAMLGTVVLMPIYSIVCSIDVIALYRIIVPLIFSLVPVGLYEAFKKLTDEKISFFATFFFLSQYEFYTWLGLTMKMVTAGYFLMLIVLMLVDDSLDKFTRVSVAVLSALALATSHYGTSYIFMFCLVSAYILKLAFEKRSMAVILTISYVLLLTSFAISWYIYNASSTAYVTMVDIGRHIVESIYKEYILPNTSYGYQVIVRTDIPTYLQILRNLYIVSTALITVGLAVVLLGLVKHRFSRRYLFLSIPFFVAGGTVFLGGLSGACTPDRMYQIISFVLSPFCVVGGIFILSKLRIKDPLKPLSIFFAIFLLFNSCFMAEVVWKYNVGPMVSISVPRIIKNGAIDEREYLYRTYMFESDVCGAGWLVRHSNDCIVYLDRNCMKVFTIVKPHNVKIKLHILKDENIKHNAYVFLNSFNTKTNMVKVRGAVKPVLMDLNEISKINNSNKIYSNGYCRVYYYS